MRVLLISAFPPSKHNLGVPSALPYYLAKNAPADFQIDLIYYQGFEKFEYLFEDDLKSVFGEVTKLPKTPKYLYYPLRLIQKLNILKGLSGVSLNHFPDVKELGKDAKQGYDLIWIYPHTLYPWATKFKHSKIVVTGPDCSYLHYQLMSDIYVAGSKELQGAMIENHHVKHLAKLKNGAYQIDKRWSNTKALIHVVGEDDRKMYEKLGAVNCFYSPHPYFEYTDVVTDIAHTDGKLTIIITGVNHSIYIGNFLDRIIDMIAADGQLTKGYKFLFLGKGFENCHEKLNNAGYETSLTLWTDCYEDFIAKANIQLIPIILGTGTKGKVLSALASGLLCIGTKYAFENIHIDEQEDCLLVENEQDVILALNNILSDKEKYTRMAKTAAGKVKFEHSAKKTAGYFWDNVMNYYNAN